MRFQVDENLPADIAELLRGVGFDADTVTQEGLKGAGDDVIAKTIQADRRVLLTLDTDFGNIQAYPPEEYWGVIVLRRSSQDKVTVHGLVARLSQVIRERSLERELWIVEQYTIRVWRREDRGPAGS